jgi:hypothetical protein
MKIYTSTAPLSDELKHALSKKTARVGFVEFLNEHGTSLVQPQSPRTDEPATAAAVPEDKLAQTG